jgi:hypothetical protein
VAKSVPSLPQLVPVTNTVAPPGLTATASSTSWLLAGPLYRLTHSWVPGADRAVLPPLTDPEAGAASPNPASNPKLPATATAITPRLARHRPAR